MLKEGLNQRVFQRARIKGPSNDMKLPDTCFPPTKVKKKKSPPQEEYASREIKIKPQFRQYLLPVHLFRLTHTNEQVDRVKPSASKRGRRNPEAQHACRFHHAQRAPSLPVQV